ncbi:MAG: NAD(P)-dependent oxidoreductase [Rhodobacteraceae bacterium]|nr:NAD(P)-dependent oxidoreductase [Paracoccaceae bacterium]
MADRLQVGWLGTGLMGAPMAMNLLAAGFPVTVWNRTPAKAEALASGGARVAASPADCAAGADVLIAMLENGSVVGEVLFAGGAAAALAPGAVVVDMSSIGPDDARVHAARLETFGVAHVDAPVSGGTVGAEAATLSIMAGGPEGAFETVRPALEAMGRPLRVGDAGAGQVAKLANQMIVATTIGAVAEALAFAEAAGADPERVRAALRGGFAESRILDLHGARMVARDFGTRGKTSSQIKDLENGLRAAAAAGAATPFAGLSLELFRRLLAADGDVDHSGLWLELRRMGEKGPQA